jgi:CubicO group peptidase (beta-lactamase class C family)
MTVNDSEPFGASTRELDALLAGIKRQTGVPGIAVVGSVRGRRFRSELGWSTDARSDAVERRPRFDTGCVTKLLMAIVAHELSARGSLDLGLPVCAYVPELQSSRHGREIRVEHLLSHTSGYQGLDMIEPDALALSWQRFVTYLDGAPRFFRPGSVFSYEHSETAILSRVLERSTGDSVERLIGEMLLAPLGICAAGFENRSKDTVYAGRHVFDADSRRFVPSQANNLNPFWRSVFPQTSLSLDELIDVAEAIVRPDHPLRPRFPSAATLEALQRPAVRLPASIGGPLSELMPVAFATGAAILRGGVLANSGMSHGQCLGLRMHPPSQTAIAVGLNATMPHLRDLVLTRIQDCLVGPGKTRAFRLEVDLSQLAGEYRGNGSNAIHASAESGRLVLAVQSPHAPSPLIAELGHDEHGAVELRSPVPQLAVGVIDDGDDPAAGLMLGLTAFKRVAGARRAVPQ